jgi:hypothetical protein
MKTKITYHGHNFASEAEYRKYLGLMKLMKEGPVRTLEVHPIYPLIVNEVVICEYSPSFKFLDPEDKERIVHVMTSAHNSTLELKIKLFEALTNYHVERWG